MVQCKNLTIAASAASLVVTAITGPDSIAVGTTSAIFTATVTNRGGSAGAVVVTFYDGVVGTVISTLGTGLIQPGESQNLSATINFGAWPAGNYTICAKTAQE